MADSLTRTVQAIPNLVRDFVRPFREWTLRLTTRRRGLRRVVNGLEVRVDSRCRHQFSSNYEAAAASFLREHITPGSVVFNIGANVGVVTLQLANWTGPTGKVIAFEPNPYANNLLKRNIRLNHLDSRVEVLDLAVGDTAGWLTLHVMGTDGMARLQEPNPVMHATEPVRVKATTLDIFVRARGLIPDWIVMDVEGWELAVLRGASDLLGENRARIEVVAEFHPAAWDWSGDSRTEAERILSTLRRKPIGLKGQSDAFMEHGQVYLQP